MFNIIILSSKLNNTWYIKFQNQCLIIKLIVFEQFQDCESITSIINNIITLFELKIKLNAT